MLRNLVFLGGIAVAFAAVPVVFQSNPEAFYALFSPASRNEAPAPTVPTVQLATQQPLGRKVSVPADARGHYAASFRLNGRQVDALVDTGATLVAITSSTARRIGLSLAPSDFRQSVTTANGATKAALVTIDRLEIGRISLDDVQAVVLDDQALQTNLIGMSFLNRLDKFQAKDGELLLAQ